VVVDVDGFRSEQPIGTEFAMLSIVKNVEFCSSFFPTTCQTGRLKSSESTILKTVYVHDHVHVHDHVLVIVVVAVNVIVNVDGFASKSSHWNKVRHE
jgi:hypothetical protein